MTGDSTQMFEVLGISHTGERVYEALLGSPASSIAALAKAVGLSRSDVTETLSILETKGLVVRTADKPNRFSASKPETALRNLLNQRRRDLELADTAIGSLVERFYATSSIPHDLVDLIRGEEAVRHRRYQMLVGARHEVLSLSKPPYSVDLEELGTSEADKLNEGVAYRMIYSYAALDEPGHLEVIRADIQAGEDARVLADLPMKVLIVDREIALMTLHLEEPAVAPALAVHPSSLLDALIFLFEVLWDKAVPFGMDPGDVGAEALSDDDRQMITLLSTGMKDEAVARHLGITSRTLRRHISRLLGEVQSQNRFQLGAQAAWRGWIKPH